MRPELAPIGRSPQIELVDFGDGAGMLVLAEYDADCDTIRVNTRVVERVRAAAGAVAAERFIVSALVHERFHRAHPLASEAAAHEYVRAVTGRDPQRFHKYVRGAKLEPS